MSNINVAVGSLNPNVSVVIAAAGTTSAAISTGGLSLVGILFPTVFTGTTVTFTMSDSLAGTYVPVKTGTAGTALSYTVAAAGYNVIDPKDFQGIAFLKIVSGSTEAASRTLVCSLKGLS